MHATLNEIIGTLKNYLEAAETEPEVSLFCEVRAIHGKSREQLNELIENAAPLPMALIMPDRINYQNLNAVRLVNLKLVVIGSSEPDYTLLDQTASLLQGSSPNQTLKLDEVNYQLRKIIPLETGKPAWMFFLAIK